MKKNITKIISLLLACCVVLGIATLGNEQPVDNANITNQTNLPVNVDDNNASLDENNSLSSDSVVSLGNKPVFNSNGVKNEFLSTELPNSNDKNANIENSIESSFNVSPTGEYNEGFVLVKVEKSFDEAFLGELKYVSYEPLFNGSKWYSVELEDLTTQEAVEYLSELGTFEKVDYDYIMGTAVAVDSIDVSCNPHYGNHKHHHTHKIPDGWKYANDKDKHPGGSNDVVVAVIDTGVDYNHLDLRNNIWVNTAEIPNNGKDDDGNGYIDDINGWNCVGDDNNPIDDNGHGTHVAGIIAAENNEIGGIGIAYNCKVMVLKAGNSSGYFNNSDIAEAIQYAYMNGASVINMSFGGASISIAVEEALEEAYNTAVLVAAAGNDSACNNLSCNICDVKKVSYPAALPYVIGVMSTNYDGSKVSSFSNYDHAPYNSVEYEVFAVGEAIQSCWPGNKYATLNGTSMAAPTVAGIAALLRSYYSDRNIYSTKYIQSQIVNTGTLNPYNHITEKVDGAHSVANIYEALTQIPKPEVNLYDYSINDSTTISANNNGNGVIDAGETIRLSVALHNRGGVATDVKVTIDTARNEDFELTDPYFTLKNTAITLSDIGTYSVRESGDKYFEIVVSPDCPNDYLANFNIRFTYKNGMDEKDDATYSGKGKAQFSVSRGYLLPATITEDTVFTNDRLYIVGENVVIPEGVTVTFEEGCQIQFYDDRAYYDSLRITVYGELNVLGTKDKMVRLYPSEQHAEFAYGIRVFGDLYIEHTDIINAVIGAGSTSAVPTICVNNSYLRIVAENTERKNLLYQQGKKYGVNATIGSYFDISHNSKGVTSYNGNYIESCYYGSLNVGNFYNNFLYIKETSFGYEVNCKNFENNIVYSSNTSLWVRDIEVTDSSVNNLFVTDEVSDLISIGFSEPANVYDNEFSKLYQQYASQNIKNYYDIEGNPTVDVYDSLSDQSRLWPYVVSVEMLNKDGELITTVGREEVKVRVTFNRPMDTTKETFLTFGTIEPYADYRIDGEYISETVWEGTYTLKAQIENGQNFLKVNNACAKEDQTKKVFGECQLHEFTIDTTAAMSMNLLATPLDNGIELTWAQDEYDTLLGYNIYRSEEKDGNYVKLNPAILLPTDGVFLDENAEPGKTYWYTYTVVLSNFTESNPAGKVMATAKDTLSPSLYHTPVNQGYENNNLVISCTASDNVSIKNVTLYYRALGDSEWKSLSMVKTNDKYSATIFGSDVTLAGLEYYIVATDGIQSVTKGSEEIPYTIVVKSADSLLNLGDIDGNGTVTTKDALMLMQCINGDLILTDDQFKRADLNKDGILSSVEALRILQYVNGKVTTLEM